MNLKTAQSLCTALPPDRVLRLARGVLRVEDEQNLTTYQILLLSLANWLEGYRICDEAQTMLVFQEFEKTLKWYAEDIEKLLVSVETLERADPALPYLVMMHDYRYFLMHNYNGFFDIREAKFLPELPAPSVTYIAVDCIALMARVRDAEQLLGRLDRAL